MPHILNTTIHTLFIWIDPNFLESLKMERNNVISVHLQQVTYCSEEGGNDLQQ